MSAVVTIIAVAGAAYAGYQAKRSADVQKKAAEAAEDRAKKQEQAALTLQQDEEKSKLQAVMRSQKRRTAAGAGEPKLRDTILTSPLGVVGDQQQQSKTLLGQ